MQTGTSIRSDWLDAFVCFATHLNFTRAARALHLSQPALHVQITKLAESLGVTLYVKQGRALELTREGTKLLAFARESRERAAQFTADLHQRSTPTPLVLCAGQGAFLYLLGDAIRAFSRQHTARLHVMTRDRAGTLEAVRSGEAHLGVASMDAEPDGITTEPFATVGQVVVMPRAHRLAKRRSLALRDLEGAALVVPPAGRPHRTMIARTLQDAGVSWTVAAEANGWELLTHFASLGIGLAIVNAFCPVPRGMVARTLRGLPSVRYALLSRAGARPHAEVARLKRHILEHAR